MTAEPLIEARELTKAFPVHAGFLVRREVSSVRAVDGVSFTVARGETLALVGESGCGKSTTGRLLMRLIEPTGGSIRFDGTDLMSLRGEGLRNTRRRLQIMFQDPSSAFNPRMSVGAIIAEPMRLAGSSARECRDRVRELLPLVGLGADQASRFPHQFSGGQRQRLGIARALALRPDFIVCDEPVSALDVSVQAQVVNLLTDLQQEFGLTYLFISHDLRVVRHIADRVAVMYLGRIVELADRHALYNRPQHPYTRILLSAVPLVKPGVERTPMSVAGEVEPANPASIGCRFAGRCPSAMPVCRAEAPALLPGSPTHLVACHLFNAPEHRPG